MIIKFSENKDCKQASVSFIAQNSMDDTIMEAMQSIKFEETVLQHIREEYQKKSFCAQIQRLGREGIKVEEIGPFLGGLLRKYYKKHPEFNDAWLDHILEQIGNEREYLIEQFGKTFIFLVLLALEALAGYSFTDLYYAYFDELNE